MHFCGLGHVGYALSDATAAINQALWVERVQVLMGKEEADRFSAFCREKGFKESTLIARLLREHLDREQFHVTEQRAARYPARQRRTA